MTANHAALLRRVAAEASDRELLTRFAVARDGDAFAELVRRYGPAVFGVCLRVTRQRQDAEDAFQAVFVILARRANTLQKPDLLGNWLYGVAVRVARKARRSAGRRRVREMTVAVMPEPGVDPLPPSDLGSVIDEELAALPEWYRDAVLLCDLYGHSRTEAAARLGIPQGTLSSRLAAGRKLADRLARRGVTASVAALVAATVQTELANAAVSNALLAVNGIPIETGIESLTHDGGRAMTKLFGWAVAAVATVAMTVGAVMALPEQKPTDPPKGEPVAQEKAPVKEAPAKPTAKPKLVRTIDLGANINTAPIWNPDGTAVGFHSGNQGLRLWDPRTGLSFGVRGYGEFLGFGSSNGELLWHFQKGGAINGTARLIGTLYSGRPATPVDIARFGESATLATELDREDGILAEVILKGKGVLAYRVDMKPNPKAGQVRKNPFGGKGGPFEGGGASFARAEPREVPDALRFRVIDTATGVAGPDIVKYPIGPIYNPRIVTNQGDRLVTAYQSEKSVTIECFALPDGKKLWKQSIEPKGPAMSYTPMTLVVSADGSTLAVKYLRMPEPPEPPDRDIGSGGFGGNPRSSVPRESGVQLFNMTSGEPGPKVPDLGSAVIHDVSLSHDGRYFAVTTTGERAAASTVQVWDLRTGKLLKSWNGEAKISFAPDRLVLAIAEVNTGRDPAPGSHGVLGLWDLSPLLK